MVITVWDVMYLYTYRSFDLIERPLIVCIGRHLENNTTAYSKPAISSSERDHNSNGMSHARDASQSSMFMRYCQVQSTIAGHILDMSIAGQHAEVCPTQYSEINLQTRGAIKMATNW